MTVPDLRDQVWRDAKEELPLTLLQQWPGCRKKESVDRSAMDCAVVVLRAIFAHLDPLAKAKYIADNPLLTFAFSDFSAETEEAALAVQRATIK